MKYIKQLGYPTGWKTVLDYGCGVGRQTRVLAKYFQRCYRIDISESMINKARERNQTVSNCKFVVNNKENINIFPDNYFDMIYTAYALQHNPSRSLIKSYISEFIHILKKTGILIFQLAHSNMVNSMPAFTAERKQPFAFTYLFCKR